MAGGHPTLPALRRVRDATVFDDPAHSRNAPAGKTTNHIPARDGGNTVSARRRVPDPYLALRHRTNQRLLEVSYEIVNRFNAY